MKYNIAVEVSSERTLTIPFCGIVLAYIDFISEKFGCVLRICYQVISSESSRPSVSDMYFAMSALIVSHSALVPITPIMKSSAYLER